MTTAPASETSAYGKREPVRVLHHAVRRVLELAAGGMHAAFEQVPDERGSADPVPVVECPPELVADRRDEQRRIGEPPADDELRVLLEAIDDRLGAEVSVGANHAVPQCLDGRAELRQVRVEIAHQVEHVVAGHHARSAHRSGRRTAARHELVYRRRRVRSAEVADHPAAAGKV